MGSELNCPARRKRSLVRVARRLFSSPGNLSGETYELIACGKTGCIGLRIKPSAETQGNRCRACDFATLSSRFRTYSSPLTASVLFTSRAETAQHLFSRLISLFITYGRLANISIESTKMIGFIPPIYHTWSPRTSDTDLSISTGVGDPERENPRRSDRSSPHSCGSYTSLQGQRRSPCWNFDHVFRSDHARLSAR